MDVLVFFDDGAIAAAAAAVDGAVLEGGIMESDTKADDYFDQLYD